MNTASAKETKGNAHKPGAEILGNLLSVVLVFSMIPSMLGFTDSTGTVASLCWLLPGLLLTIVVVYLLLSSGNIIMGSLYAVMLGLMTCNLLGRGIILWSFLLAGREVPAGLLANFELLSGGGYIAGGIYMGTVALINVKLGKKAQGAWMLVATAGFLLLGAACLGLHALARPGQCCIIAFACSLLHAAIMDTGKLLLCPSRSES